MSSGNTCDERVNYGPSIADTPESAVRRRVIYAVGGHASVYVKSDGGDDPRPGGTQMPLASASASRSRHRTAEGSHE